MGESCVGSKPSFLVVPESKNWPIDIQRTELCCAVCLDDFLGNKERRICRTCAIKIWNYRERTQYYEMGRICGKAVVYSTVILLLVVVAMALLATLLYLIQICTHLLS